MTKDDCFAGRISRLGLVASFSKPQGLLYLSFNDERRLLYSFMYRFFLWSKIGFGSFSNPHLPTLVSRIKSAYRKLALVAVARLCRYELTYRDSGGDQNLGRIGEICVRSMWRIAIAASFQNVHYSSFN
ncbi:hypothetical protein L1887_41942 [Cichorium endivia]|nr:hypothetical protein L1887_41942 [Cichorium endivia]